MIISRSVNLRKRNGAVESCGDNQNTHYEYMLSNFSFTETENLTVYEIMWKKYSTARQATDDNMAHAHCMLDI